MNCTYSSNRHEEFNIYIATTITNDDCRFALSYGCPSQYRCHYWSHFHRRPFVPTAILFSSTSICANLDTVVVPASTTTTRALIATAMLTAATSTAFAVIIVVAFFFYFFLLRNMHCKTDMRVCTLTQVIYVSRLWAMEARLRHSLPSYGNKAAPFKTWWCHNHFDAEDLNQFLRQASHKNEVVWTVVASISWSSAGIQRKSNPEEFEIATVEHVLSLRCCWSSKHDVGPRMLSSGEVCSSL